MTHKILKSNIKTVLAATPGHDTVDAAVAQHAADLALWHERELLVTAQAPLSPQPVWAEFAAEKDPAAAFTIANAKWEKQKLTHASRYPRPATHPDIDAAVTADIAADGSTKFVADFDVVNDDPTDEQVLREKKNALLGKIYHAEEAAKERALPPIGKRRLLNLQENDIVQADAKSAKHLFDNTPEAARPQLDMAKELKKLRDPTHTQHLQDQESRRAKVDAIARIGAQAMSDVEDLTADNIDAFEIPSFER